MHFNHALSYQNGGIWTQKNQVLDQGLHPLIHRPKVISPDKIVGPQHQNLPTDNASRQFVEHVEGEGGEGESRKGRLEMQQAGVLQLL